MGTECADDARETEWPHDVICTRELLSNRCMNIAVRTARINESFVVAPLYDYINSRLEQASWSAHTCSCGLDNCKVRCTLDTKSNRLIWF